MKNEKFSFRKAWEVLFPFIVYYLVYNAVYLMLAFLYQATVKRFGGAYGQFMTAQAATVTGVVGGLCSVAGVLVLFPMLKRELRTRAEEKTERAAATSGRERILELTMTVILAVSASLGLNALLTLTGFSQNSSSYQKVADHQYGVAFGIGLVLYGLVSPLAEEVLFRGVIYNRLRRLFGPVIGIVASALFFGAFHGNIVQGVYGMVMGILMAYLYERSGKFFIPFLFHAVANLAVYTVAHVQMVQAVLFTPWGCVILLAVAVVCLCLEKKGKKR